MNSEQYNDDLRAKQRNLVWPDTLRNGRAIDAFLFKGSPHPTRTQRIAAWMFGLMIFVYGVILLSMGKAGGSVLFIVFSYGVILLGALIFRNGFARKKKRE